MVKCELHPLIEDRLEALAKRLDLLIWLTAATLGAGGAQLLKGILPILGG